MPRGRHARFRPWRFGCRPGKVARSGRERGFVQSTNSERPNALTRLLGAATGEGAALGWSFLYFFSLLAAYYVLRPVRDALGTPYPLQWLFLCTFVVMLCLVPAYGHLVARIPRRRLLPTIYLIFIACLVFFFGLMSSGHGGVLRDAGFFVWVAVFNLFAVSVFWSFMSDIFDNDQAKRLFGAIGAGGTAGTLVGSTLTITLVKYIGVPNMLLVSAALLGLSLVCIFNLIPWAVRQEKRRGWRSGEDAIGGSIFGGAMLIGRSRFLIACCCLMFFGVAVGTLLYNQQQAYARLAIPDRDERAHYFAILDFAINTLVLLMQLSITRLLMTRFGVGPMLIFPAVLVGTGFALLTASPLPLLMSVVQVITRAGNFALIQPARESLFTRVDRESRYKSKNFIDTVVYRGGDLTFAWVHTGLTQVLGFGLAGVALVGIAMATCMGLASAWVVRESRRLPAKAPERDTGADDAENPG